MRKSNIYLGFIVIALIYCFQFAQAQSPKVIIDADTANEVDDLFALARAVAEPNIDLLGITSAQFHISPLASDSSVYESQKINEEIVKLMGRTDIALPLGSNEPLIRSDRAQLSPASGFIIDQAHQLADGEKLHIVILGACTNVASAIIQDPSIISKIKVYYLGFWHNPATNVYNKKEFNSGNDTLAVNVLLNTLGLDLSVMTATTSQHLVFEKNTVDEKAQQIGPIGSYLVNRWESHKRWWTQEDKIKQKWVMWDVAIVEALIHPEMSMTHQYQTPPENESREITIYTAIDVDKMHEDFWESLVEYYNKGR